MKTRTNDLGRAGGRGLRVASATICAVALGAAAVAQDMDSRGLDDDSQEFVGKAATETAALIDGSKLAVERTRFPEVREFAQQTADQLGKIQEGLDSVANESGFTGIATPDLEEKQEILDDVQEEAGEDFEEAYVETVVNTLEDLVGRFNEAAEDGEDPAVREFAQKFEPSLRQCHERAQRLDERLDEITDRPMSTTG